MLKGNMTLNEQMFLRSDFDYIHVYISIYRCKKWRILCGDSVQQIFYTFCHFGPKTWTNCYKKVFNQVSNSIYKVFMYLILLVTACTDSGCIKCMWYSCPTISIFFSSCAMSLWHTAASVSLSICRSIYLSIHDFKMLFLKYALMDFCDTWIQQSSGRGTLGVFRNLGSKVI